MRKIIFISLLLAIAAYAQPKRIAIMGTEDDGEPSIELLALSHLTAKFREVASDILPKERYGVMTQQSIVDRLGSQEQAVKLCREATCLADLGRKVNADYIAQARIGRFDGNLTIRAELYNVASGNLLASFTSVSKDVQGLLEVLDARAPELLRKMPGVVPDPPPPPPVAEPEKIIIREEPVYEYDYEYVDERESVKFGLRLGFNVNDFSFGYKGQNEEISNGIGFGAGLMLNMPLASQWSFNMGLDLYYRGLFSREAETGKESMNEFAVSIPVFLRFALVENGLFHLMAGVQLDIPFETKWDSDYNYFTSHRASVDFGVALGLVYMAGPSIGIDFKCVIGLIGLFEDFEHPRVVYEGSNSYEDKSSLRQYGLGVLYFF